MAPLSLPPTVPDETWLFFTPVPVKPRHDGWTAERQRAFILMLAQLGSVRQAAASVGKSRRSAYQLRRRDGAESFAAAWDRALAGGEDNAIRLGVERALHGMERPYFYRGRRVATCRVYDNALLRAALRALDRRWEKLDHETLMEDYYKFAGDQDIP